MHSFHSRRELLIVWDNMKHWPSPQNQYINLHSPANKATPNPFNQFPFSKKKKLAWTCWTSSSSKQFQCLCVTLRQRDFSSFESHDPERSRPNPLHRWHFRTASLCISGQLTDWWCFNDIIKPMIYVNVQPKSHNWDKCLAVTCSATDTLPWSESSPLCVCS